MSDERVRDVLRAAGEGHDFVEGPWRDGVLYGVVWGMQWADENQTVTPQALFVAYEEGLRDAHEMFPRPTRHGGEHA